MSIPVRWEIDSRLSYIFKYRNTFSPSLERIVHLKKYNLEMNEYNNPPSLIRREEKNVHPDCTCQLLNDSLAPVSSIVPQAQCTSECPPLQKVSIKGRGNIKDSTTIPKVMSASSVAACGDTSEGSTAAKLEVASPKSPTIE